MRDELNGYSKKKRKESNKEQRKKNIELAHQTHINDSYVERKVQCCEFVGELFGSEKEKEGGCEVPVGGYRHIKMKQEGANELRTKRSV